MASKKRTRLRTYTHCSNLTGTGRDLLPSELQTLQKKLKHGDGLLPREQWDDVRNYPVVTLAKDIFLKVFGNEKTIFLVIHL